MNGPQPPSGVKEKEIFLEALEKAPPEERAAYLNAACGKDLALRAAVEDLLRNHLKEPFLEQPATLIASAAEVQRRQTTPVGDPFPPGELFGDRYRIVGLLGEGGMGKVYRADDLKLGQSVALKFLPLTFATDPVWLLRFRNEVRVAREVAHPNVCRVYDIGEAEGEHFISMEFVDGEDLASLLRRIGRLPQDKAVDIARQLCAGLAAAHARGVVHRDLKPANIMIDGRGKVRITDFGIAALAGQAQGREVRAGTPSYMAPEQLAGTEVTPRSDIYSLGLVLYEVFTGKKAIDGTSITQVERAQSRGAPPTPASHVRDLDPQVERIILRCLELDPKNRPRSAMAVAAALPGADPLAEAIAAGETPSPELLAEAGESGTLRPWIAVTCLLGVVAGLIAIIALKDRASLLRRVPLDKRPEVLADRAEQISQRLGYTNAIADKAYWIGVRGGLLDYLEKLPPTSNRWQRLASGRPSALLFSYRAASQKMAPMELAGRIQWADPPFFQPGMRRLNLDTKGRLLTFQAVPPNYQATPRLVKEIDWSLLFNEAELDMRNFTSVPPIWTPEMYCDNLVAWTGPYPNWPGETLRVEAGSFAGAPVSFDLIESWRKPPSKEPRRPNDSASMFHIFAETLDTLVGLSVLVAGGYFARQNLRAGRGDRSGARRLGWFTFLIFLGEYACVAHSWTWWELATKPAIWMAGAGLVTWLSYVAIEPYARRVWPHALVSWSRLLAGRVRDPSVGRDLLIGCLVGLVYVVPVNLLEYAPQIWSGIEPVQLYMPRPLTVLLGGRYVMARILWPMSFLSLFMGVLLFLLVLRMIFKRDWATVLAFFGVMSVLVVLEAPTSWVDWVTSLARDAIIAAVTVRFGLLALFVMIVTINLTMGFSATFDFSVWWAESAIILPLFVLAVATYGCWVSMAGKPLFKDEVLAK